MTLLSSFHLANTNATIVTTVIDKLRWCTKALQENLIGKQSINN